MKKLFVSRKHRSQETLSRRTFLAAVGMGISVPLALQMSKLVSASPAERPGRLFIYFVPHGVPIEHYEPGAGMDLSTGNGVLAPLEPYKSYLTVMRGVSNQVMDNHDAIRGVLTGSDDKSDSIDYLIANALGTSAHVLGLQSYRSGSPGPDHDSKLARHGAYVTPVLNPADALDDLFVGLGGGAMPQPGAGAATDFRNEALTLTEGEVAALQTQISALTAEKNKLQVHLDSLAALKASSAGGGATVSCDKRPALPNAERMAGKNVFGMEHFAQILDGHLEAAAHAFVCGSARIVTLQNMHANAQLSMDFPGGPGIAMNHHDPLSHSQDEGGRAQFALAQRWFYQRLVDKFISVLDTPDPQDPAHTVLDNTTILTCTEICDGNMHNSAAGDKWILGGNKYTYLPWNIIGGGAGLFAGGRVANMEGVDHRNILSAVAEAMGVNLSTIAGHAVATPSELKA